MALCICLLMCMCLFICVGFFLIHIASCSVDTASTPFVEKMNEYYEFCYELGGTNAITLYDLYFQTRLAHFADFYLVLGLKFT